MTKQENQIVASKSISLTELIKVILERKKVVYRSIGVFFLMGLLLCVYQYLNPKYQFVAEITPAYYIQGRYAKPLQPAENIKNYINYLIDYRSLNFGLPAAKNQEPGLKTRNIQIVFSSLPQGNLLLIGEGAKKNQGAYNEFFDYAAKQLSQMQSQVAAQQEIYWRELITQNEQHLELLKNQHSDLVALLNQTNQGNNKASQFLLGLGSANAKVTGSSNLLAQDMTLSNFVSAYADLGARSLLLTKSNYQLLEQANKLSIQILQLKNNLATLQPARLDQVSYNNLGPSISPLLVIAESLFLGLFLGILIALLGGLYQSATSSRRN